MTSCINNWNIINNNMYAYIEYIQGSIFINIIFINNFRTKMSKPLIRIIEYILNLQKVLSNDNQRCSCNNVTLRGS